MKLIKHPFKNKFIKTNDVVIYKLEFFLEALPKCDNIIELTADSNFVLFVNENKLCWGNHRNFPENLMLEKCNIKDYLKCGRNIIKVYVRHIYMDTFSYLQGEAAFGLNGKIGDIDLSTENNMWKSACFTGNNSYTPRINMHLAPFEDYNYKCELNYKKPILCETKRSVENHKMLPLIYEEVTPEYELIGSVQNVNIHNGDLYGFSYCDLKNKCVKLYIEPKNSEKDKMFISVNGDGGFLKTKNAEKVFATQKNHCGQESFFTDKDSFYLYIINATFTIDFEADIRVLGYYEFDSLHYSSLNNLIENSALKLFEKVPSICKIKKEIFFDWRNIKPNEQLLKNSLIIDLKKFYYGNIKIEFDVIEKNSQIFIGYGFDKDLSVWTWDKFIGCKCFENLFTPRGFRYVFIYSECNFNVKNIKIYSPLSKEPKKLGNFETNIDSWNKIYNTSLRTLKYSRTDAICSDNFRELAVWLGDTYFISQNYYYSYYDKEFIKYTLKLYSENITSEGIINTVVPSYMPFHIPTWTFCYWLALENYCLHTGDTAFIKKIWNKCLSTFEYYEKYKNKDGLFQNIDLWLFLDWAETDFSGISFVQNSFYLFSLNSLIKLAEIIEDKDNVLKFENIAKKMRKSLTDEIFFDSERNLFFDNDLHTTISQHTQIFAYYFGLWDEKKNGNIIDRILDDKINMCTLGESSYHWACDILENDKNFYKYINFIRKTYEYKLKESMDSFGHCHPHNRPNDYVHCDSSPCHSWACVPIYISGKFILGVRPLEIGYNKVLIAPKILLNDLTYFKGEVPTPYGNIKIEINIKEGYIKGSLPKKIKAYFEIPTEFKKSEIEGMRKIKDNYYELTDNKFKIKSLHMQKLN